MRSIVFFCFIILALSETQAQGIFLKPDYESIKKDMQADSAGYYALLSRLEENDTTLTSAEYRYLYYGYVFTKNYQPYWRFDKDEELEPYYRKKKISEKDYDKVLALTSEALAQFPFDLQKLNYSIYVCHTKGDIAMAKKQARRYYNTLNAIFSTGNGETCETAYHVISTSNEYTILGFYDFEFKMQSLRGNCDYLTVAKNKQGVKGLYFDVSRLFERMREMMKDRN